MKIINKKKAHIYEIGDVIDECGTYYMVMGSRIDDKYALIDLSTGLAETDLYSSLEELFDATDHKNEVTVYAELVIKGDL